MHLTILDTINLTVHAVKGEYNSKGNHIEPHYVLFSDNETFIQFEEQDYYIFHDCAASARHISVIRNKILWEQINLYKNATTDL